jgi:hypothetical protein
VLGNGPSGSLASDDAGNATPVSPAGLSVSALAPFTVANIAPAAAEVFRNARLFIVFLLCARFSLGLKKSIHEHLCGEDEHAADSGCVRFCFEIVLRSAPLPRSEARNHF